MTPATARSARFSGALLWDLDGTILTTAKAGRIALRAAIREIAGEDLDYSELRVAGLTDAEVASVALRSVGISPTTQLIARVAEEYEQRLPDALLLREGSVLPGVREALDGLAVGGRVVSLLATGNSRPGAEAKLRRYGVADRFPHGGAFCEGDLRRVDIVHRALAIARGLLNGEGISKVALLGDTPFDVACARESGIRAIGVATGSHSQRELRDAGAWVVVERVPEAQALENLVLGG